MFAGLGSMSELLSALEELRGEELSRLPDARLEEDFAELQRAGRCSRPSACVAWQRSSGGDRSPATGTCRPPRGWRPSFKVGWGQAKDQVRAARGLEQMPETRRALEAGELSLSAAKVLVAAREADPGAFSRCESTLVEAARIHQVRDLQRVTTQWRQMVERGRGEGEQELRAMRGLYVSGTLRGMTRVDGDLDPESGESLMTALRAIMDAESRGGGEDPRSPAQRRADALGEICRQWLDHGGRPSVGGERPHVSVTVDVDALRAWAGGMSPGGSPAPAGAGPSEAHASPTPPPAERRPAISAELDHAGPVHPELARRIACDASIRRVVMSGRSEPLDVGRRTPVVPAGMRRAVILRDRHCRFPGCDRPQTWCDAHHVIHWADGGPTALSNLVLLCRRHHRMLHEPRGFRLHLEDGRAVFRRPDGSVLEDRAPP